MPRSQVLTGLKNQRDRAQLRHRLDSKRSQAAADPRVAMENWLESKLRAKEASEIARLDLTAYLRQTGEIDLPAPERLRFLAMFLEHEVASSSLETWLALDRIYEAALGLDGEDPWVHHSRAVCAKYFAEGFCRDEESELRRRILATAWSAAFEAARLAPETGDVWYLLGSLAYEDSSRGIPEALEYFEKAIEVDPKHPWAMLYRAHCLQDLERWKEASKAYGDVDPSFFEGPLAWRYEALLEQRAYCSLQAGDARAAADQFRVFLKRWATASEHGRLHLGECSTQSISGDPIRSKLWTDLAALAERNEWPWLSSAMEEVPNNEVPNN